MSLSFERLTSFLDSAEIRYLLVPHQPVVALGAITDSGRHFLVHAVIEAEGSLLQFRTTGYLVCRPTSEHFPAVLALLNELNYRLRLAKFTIDPDDGEIVVFADLAILDSEPTLTQILGMISFLMERLRECSGRIEEVIQTGEDPGEEEMIGEEPVEEEQPDDIIE